MKYISQIAGEPGTDEAHDDAATAVAAAKEKARLDVDDSRLSRPPRNWEAIELDDDGSFVILWSARYVAREADDHSGTEWMEILAPSAAAAAAAFVATHLGGLSPADYFDGQHVYDEAVERGDDVVRIEVDPADDGRRVKDDFVGVARWRGWDMMGAYLDD